MGLNDVFCNDSPKEGNDHEVNFHEIEIRLFHDIKITIMRSKLDLIMRSKLGLNIWQIYQEVDTSIMRLNFHNNAV